MTPSPRSDKVRRPEVEAEESPAARRNDGAPAAPVWDTLQQSIGNAALGKLVQAHELAAGEGLTAVDAPVQAKIDGTQSKGRPLDAGLRAEMEPALGADLSDVRVQRGPASTDLARQLDARAFTQGSNVYLGAGVNEATPRGRETLSHELTHAVAGRAGPGTVQREPEEEKPPEGATPAPATTPASEGAAPAEGKAPAEGTAPAEGAAAPPAAAPTADELTTRIVNCIGIWETNRGKDEPAPKESALDTVAGVKASMATIEQATTPYAITALKGHKELREKASPALTVKELNEAETRVTAVTTLLSSVATASSAGTTAEDFIKDNADAITATGLSNDDVQTMFSAVTLKSTIDKSNEELGGKKDKESVKGQIDAIPAESRLGLGEPSLSAYIKDPKKWGENRAAWQRKAVEAMGDDVGTRIEAASTADSGTALATPVVKTRVDTQLAKETPPSTEELVKAVGQQNNPNEDNYGKNVWETYQRLYP